mgnify:CR=1 FL=1
MCRLQQQPLLYIVSPTYSVEIVQQEESTSVYERPTPQVIEDELIKRQLHFFARPRKNPQPLLFVMRGGERVVAILEELQGADVKVRMADEVKMINGNEINAIYRTK